MFLTFALITLIGALAMSRQKNLVVAGLCLVLCFLGVSGLFLLLANPVAAALQVIVYAGAIVVLLLFVIMLLSAHEEEAPLKNRGIQRWGGALVVALLGAGAVKLVASSKLLQPGLAARLNEGPVTLERVGRTLFQQHLLAFEAAGLLLLAAMVAAVMLVKKEL
jgi:NADH-quinone oxidoreductase subunit J